MDIQGIFKNLETYLSQRGYCFGNVDFLLENEISSSTPSGIRVSILHDKITCTSDVFIMFRLYLKNGVDLNSFALYKDTLDFEEDREWCRAKIYLSKEDISYLESLKVMVKSFLIPQSIEFIKSL
jgi:hypothetical protein